MSKLSAAIATHNEKLNIGDCLSSIQNIVDEIVIVDGTSSDNTVEIAKSFGAKVEVVPNDPMFHKMKQKSFYLASGNWILYLDADERISPQLAKEIIKIINMNSQESEDYQFRLKGRELFQRHQKLLEQKDNTIGTKNGDYVAFFFPRRNFFLGKYLKYGGVYPDGVIRLFKKGKAYLPCKDIHEQMVVEGRVGWLQNDLLHIDSPTFKRYLERNDRYVNLLADELSKDKLERNFFQFINYMIFKPIWWFLMTQIRYKGVLDGFQGIIFSFFSALRFPRAYWKYLNIDK